MYKNSKYTKADRLSTVKNSAAKLEEAEKQ